MHRLRVWLAAGTTLAVLAASGAVFAQNAPGGFQGKPSGPAGGGPAQVAPWHPGHPGHPGSGGGSHVGPLSGGSAHRTARGPQAPHPAGHPVPRGYHRGFLPPFRRNAPVPPATCYAMTTVAGTISGVYTGSFGVVEADGQAVTLPWSANVVVTEGGAPVPVTALATGETVDATVDCQGMAVAISIVG